MPASHVKYRQVQFHAVCNKPPLDVNLAKTKMPPRSCIADDSISTILKQFNGIVEISLEYCTGSVCLFLCCNFLPKH